MEGNFKVPRETPSSSAGTMPSLSGEDLATDVRFRWLSLKRNRLLMLLSLSLSLSQVMSNGEREETVKGESGTWELTRAGWKSSLAAQEAMASEFV